MNREAERDIICLTTQQINSLKIVIDTISCFMQAVNFSFTEKGMTILKADDTEFTLVHFFVDKNEIEKDGSYFCARDITGSFAM